MEINYNQYKGKRVLVTGHTGFKGAWLITILNLLGAEVLGYALEPENKECIFNKINGENLCKSIIADIRDKSKLEDTILDFKPDFIFHLAAQALVLKSYESPSETFEINIIGTANLLEMAKKLNTKCNIIVITTDKVYENNESGIHYKEQDRLGGHDPYSASKACTEITLASFRDSFFNTSELQNHQKAIASARAGNVIGGGDYSKNRIIPDLIRSLEQSEDLLIRSPKAIRPWQHVLEPLFAYLKLGLYLNEKPAAYSKSFNIGPLPDDHLTVEELISKAIEIWGSGSYSIDEREKVHEAATLRLDISLAKKDLNWLPIYNSSKAIEKTIEWYKAEDKRDFTNRQIEEYLSEIQ